MWALFVGFLIAFIILNTSDMLKKRDQFTIWDIIGNAFLSLGVMVVYTLLRGVFL